MSISAIFSGDMMAYEDHPFPSCSLLCEISFKWETIGKRYKGYTRFLKAYTYQYAKKKRTLVSMIS